MWGLTATSVPHFITFPSSLLIHVLVFSSDSAFMPNGLDSFSVFHLSNGAAARKTSGISSNHPSPLLSFIVGVQTVTWRSFRKVFSVTPLCIIHRFIYISQTVVSANISTFFSVDLLRDEGGTAIGCFSGCWSVSLFENHFRSWRHNINSCPFTLRIGIHEDDVFQKYRCRSISDQVTRSRFTLQSSGEWTIIIILYFWSASYSSMPPSFISGLFRDLFIDFYQRINLKWILGKRLAARREVT